MFISAQLAGNEVVYSVLLTNARNPLGRDEVESHFEGELSKRYPGAGIVFWVGGIPRQRANCSFPVLSQMPCPE